MFDKFVENVIQHEREDELLKAAKRGDCEKCEQIVAERGDDVLRRIDPVAGATPLHWASSEGHVNVVKLFVAHKAILTQATTSNDGMTPIHWAVIRGHVGVVDVLLTEGVDVNVRDARGQSPLLVACANGQTTLVGYLLEKGANRHLVDNDGDTCIHWAAYKGRSDLVQLLCFSGINANVTDHHGQTPLHLACINGDLRTVKLLVEEGLDISQVDKKGKTPLMLAQGRKHERLVNYLESKLSPRQTCNIKTLILGTSERSQKQLIFVYATTCASYVLYYLNIVPLTWNSLFGFHVFFTGLAVVLWTLFFVAKRRDPGFLPTNTSAYASALKDLSNYGTWGKTGSLPRLCHTCRLVKQARSKHCTICNRCVDHFDHHCPYLDQCIGYRNRVLFLIFILCMTINCWMGTYFLFHYWQLTGALWSIVFTVVIYVPMSPLVTGLFLMQLFLVKQNMTTNEMFNRHRYEAFRNQSGNPYDRGIKMNVLEYFNLVKPVARIEETHNKLDV